MRSAGEVRFQRAARLRSPVFAGNAQRKIVTTFRMSSERRTTKMSREQCQRRNGLPASADENTAKVRCTDKQPILHQNQHRLGVILHVASGQASIRSFPCQEVSCGPHRPGLRHKALKRFESAAE